MARRGASCPQIVGHYFPGTRVSPEANSRRRDVADEPVGHGDGDIVLVSAENTAASRYVWTPELRYCVLASNSSLTLSSEHFRVGYPAGVERTEIEALLRVLEAARLYMLARAGPASLHVPDTAIDVVVHDTTRDFITATGQPWWVAGSTHGNKIELQPLGVLRRRRILISTLRHEYAHAVIEGVSQGHAPRWLAEGLAIAFAGEGPSLSRFIPRRQISVDELERRLAAPRSAGEMRSLYAAAYAEVRSLVQKEGEPAVWRHLKTQSASAAFLLDRWPDHRQRTLAYLLLD